MSMKNPNDPIGNQTHVLLVCSAVPQPTVPLHIPFHLVKTSISCKESHQPDFTVYVAKMQNENLNKICQTAPCTGFKNMQCNVDQNTVNYRALTGFWKN
jgi:hypothetical protein